MQNKEITDPNMMDEQQLRKFVRQQQFQLTIAGQEREKLRELLKESENQRLVLEETIKSHKEDFMHERRDRERTQARLNDVESELSAIKRQQRQQQIQQMQDLSQRRQAALDFHKEEYRRKHPHSPEHVDIVADGGEDELDSGVGMTCNSLAEDCLSGGGGGRRINSVVNRNDSNNRNARYESDGYDDIDGGFEGGEVNEGGLDEDPNGAFECDQCKRRFGPTGFVTHMSSCTGK